MNRETKTSAGSLLPRISVTRPVTVTMCLVALLAVGVVSYSGIRIQAFATGLESSFIYVGAYIPSDISPHEKDQQVGRPMWEHFGTLKGLRKFDIKSTETNTSSRLYFRRGLDMSEVYNRLMDRVDQLKIPLALIGVILVLYLLGISLSVVVFLGLIMLAGIVVNNAIVMVDYINRLRRGGMAKFDAIAQAASVRFRPIVMTTSITVLGLLPMALGLGEGAEIRTPMAIAVVAGLISATVLTLVIIPTVYSLVDRGD